MRPSVREYAYHFTKINLEMGAKLVAASFAAGVMVATLVARRRDRRKKKVARLNGE
jgi:hypothetical protein